MIKAMTRTFGWLTFLFVLIGVSCSPSATLTDSVGTSPAADSDAYILTLPILEQGSNQGQPVQIVTTTGIIGDVASAIADNDADVISLMAPNQDPHGYQSSAKDLQMAADADAVLVNGWRLEEGLIEVLENVVGGAPLVPVSAGIVPRMFDAGVDDADAFAVDPHVWLSPLNVVQWTNNIEYVLSTLDPSHAESYARRADEYRVRLHALDQLFRERLEPIDTNKRILVTNHDAFGYFAEEYDFTILGTIIPGSSSLSEPAARDLADLIEKMREAEVCALFVEHSASQRLASQLAEELDHCDSVQIVQLYTGALGDSGSGAETYLTMMEANLGMIVDALVTGNNGPGAG